VLMVREIAEGRGGGTDAGGAVLGLMASDG
jgi:hypothetical protein